MKAQLMTQEAFDKLENNTQYVYGNKLIKTEDNKYYFPTTNVVDDLDLDEIEYEYVTRKDNKKLVIHFSENFMIQLSKEVVNLFLSDEV